MYNYDDIEKLAKLKKDGSITEQEFNEQKTVILEHKLNASTAHKKSGVIYLLLAWFTGIFGFHNFYAGYEKKAIVQLVLTMFSWILFFIPLLIVAVWSFAEMLTINKDANGNHFTSNTKTILILRIIAVAFVLTSYFGAISISTYLYYPTMPM